MTPHFRPGVASDAPLLAVRDGGGDARSTTGDTASGTSPGGGGAHLDRDDDRDGEEGSRGVLDQAGGGDGGEGGGGEGDHFEGDSRV